jgi:hypothetical protein
MTTDTTIRTLRGRSHEAGLALVQRIVDLPRSTSKSLPVTEGFILIPFKLAFHTIRLS